MISFELSAIDLILAIAVIILLILYITKLSTKPSVEKKLLVEKESSSKEPKTEVPMLEVERKRPVTSQPQTSSATCPFGFGYLRKLDKDASIPDGCLRCRRIMECHSASE